MRYSENPKQYRKDYYTNHKEIIKCYGKKNEIDLIEKVNKLSPNQPLLLMEMLFFKEKQEIVKYDNSIEYYFTFLQY